MIQLRQFSGKWNPGMHSIMFSWDASAFEKERFIVIAAIEDGGNGLRIDQSNTCRIDMQEQGAYAQAEIRLQGNAAPGVTKKKYFAVAAETTEELTDASILKAAAGNLQMLTNIMIGRSEAEWSKKEVRCGPVKLITFTVKADQFIDSGVLGYVYTVDNMNVRNFFPKIYPGSKQTFGPIAIPAECELTVTAYEDGFSGNLALKEKKHFGLFG